MKISAIAHVYASLIIKGFRKIEEVPKVIRPQVIQVLKDLDVYEILMDKE